MVLSADRQPSSEVCVQTLKQAVKTYLDAIAGVSRVGTPELSHYTALDNLFDAGGAHLSPKVRAVVHYSETSGGQPDLGFFSADQPQPDRGVVEVKGADYDIETLIASEQVDHYWRTHKLVLATNLREFALVGQDHDGAKTTLERYSLAESNVAFCADSAKEWRAVACQSELSWSCLITGLGLA